MQTGNKILFNAYQIITHDPAKKYTNLIFEANAVNLRFEKMIEISV